MLELYRYAAGKFPVKFQTYRLTGSDVFSFLQKQSTYNFNELGPNHFHLLSMLDTQGRVEFYAWALNAGKEVLLLVPVWLKESALVRLEKFLISEDVTIDNLAEQTWQFIVGPEAREASDNSFKGILFEEPAILTQQTLNQIPVISDNEIHLWRSLTGWPDFSGNEFKSEIINNLRLYDLCVSSNKGCYPGQETVSKIATRRGAAYSPILLESKKSLPVGQIIYLEKKIGEVTACFEWQGAFYSPASLLRDFRVSGMQLEFEINGRKYQGTVRYYPLIPGGTHAKALELYYLATEDFQKDLLNEAEEKFRLAISLDPKLADAYESLGVMLGRQERFQEAIEIMHQLSAVDPGSVLAHTNKSLFLMRLGKIEEAEQEKAQATLKSFQKFGEEARLKEQQQKEKQAQEEEWRRREEMFRQVLEIDEEDTLANYGIGSIAVERKEWPRAITHLEKVLSADPNYSVAYLALGKAYKGAGLSERAKTVWETGVAIAAKKGDLMPANQMQSELQNL